MMLRRGGEIRHLEGVGENGVAGVFVRGGGRRVGGGTVFGS